MTKRKAPPFRRPRFTVFTTFSAPRFPALPLFKSATEKVYNLDT